MKLTGSQYKLFTEALLSAFPSQPDLSWMVRTRLNQNLEAIAKGDNLRDIVSNLIKWAEADGRTNELLNAACQEKPGNPELKAFAAQLEREQREAEPKTTPVKTDESDQTNNPTLQQTYLRRLVERIGTLNLAQINPDQSRGINLEDVYVDSPTPLTLSVEVKNWRVIDWWLTRTDQPTPNPDRNRTEPPRDKPEKFGYQNAPFETLIAKLNTEIESYRQANPKAKPDKEYSPRNEWSNGVKKDVVRLHLNHLAAACDRLVILGAPGSGKSTFVRYLALCLAGACLANWTRHASLETLDNWWHKQLIPIYIELRRFVSSAYFPQNIADLATADHL